MSEDIKLLKIVTVHGGDFGIKTRMPVKEIRAEIMGGDDRDPIFMQFIGLNDAEQHVDVAVCRDHLSAYLILPYVQSMIARPQMAGIIQ